WAELLDLDEVGVHDDFFELGGHSLLATQLVSRVRDTLGVELPLRAVFETPSVAGMATALPLAGAKDLAPPLVRVPREMDLPASFAQQRLWFLDRLVPDNPLYNIYSPFQLQGALEVAALRSAFTAVVRRHETLRTTFRSVDGEPRQVIAPPFPLPVPVVDLRALPERRREAELGRLSAAEGLRPFDLTSGPLLRATLVRLGAERNALLLNVHHIVSDGWSTGILFRELVSLYEAFTRGEAEAGLPKLEIQYADFSVWQRQWLSGEVLEREVGYWKEQLSGAPHRLELPTDRPHPAVQSFRGRVRSTALSPDLAAALTALSRQQGATTFMTLLAGFQALLGRHTGQQDISVGTPIAGRNHRELEALIGFFVNTLVLRTDLSSDEDTTEPSFLKLLARVRRVALDAYAHQDVPFERLVEELHPQRDLSTTPLFQAMFALQNAPRETLDLPGLSLSPVGTEAGGAAKFELTLSLEESAAGIVGGIEYNADLFDDSTMARLLAHFERLLEGAVEDPARRLSGLCWWTEPERHQLLIDWNDSRGEPAGGRTIHELFEAQVERSPEAVAVVHDGRRLSYRELNLRANRLAHRLRALGVAPEVPVAIYLERSPEIVIAILGILKAGGHYVPLDPAYPRQRFGFMVEDGRIPILVTRETLAAELPASEARTLCLDSPGPDPCSAEENPASGAAVGNLAYVIYTSGSTGRPKGVGCAHVGVINLLGDFTSRAPIEVGDACSWWTSSNFDVSVYEVFSALLAGGNLHIVPERVRAEGERLVEWLAAERIASAYISPSMLQDLADRAGNQPHHLALRRLLVGVEPISEGLLAAIREGITGLRIINGYGPTEATVCATLYNVRRRPDAERTTPIGRGLRNTSIRLLDRHLRPVPAGGGGELAIGGAGLARGYQHRPQLTAERFIPDPFSEQGGARLYRTGDLVRALSTGEMMFQGRIDHQVKIRGFRIELGEIEAVLGGHPSVREVAVIVAGAERLVAFVVAGDEAGELEADALRAYAAESLPDYMVPAVVVELPALPLTPNGKLDRVALGRRTLPEEAADDFVAPRNPLEQELSELMGELLGTGPVSVHRDFFALGGHSLLAVRLVAGIRSRFGRELPLAALFQGATVERLAA
ncbi:MAG: amino acid adenylation domain-containing protein, partial [bacterium]|nr:amino acid adenylation domain-containing protein [bacterium]